MTRDRQRLERYDASASSYMIMQITDEYHASQVALEDGETYFMARLRRDRVHRHVDAAGAVRYRFEHIPDDEDGEVHVYSKFGEVDIDTFRGGEFSELLKWDRHMLVFDGRTGIVGELRGPNHMIIPRQMLMTGSGDEAQTGFKCEWATLYGDELIVGSHRKVRREEWIKRIGPRGYTVTSEDRGDIYRRMRGACGGRRGWLRRPRGGGVAPLPPALVPQSLHRGIPRSDGRAREGQQPADRGRRGLRSHRGPPGRPRRPGRGPSSIKLVPGHPDEFIYIKSMELGAMTESWIGVADLEGNLLAHEEKLVDRRGMLTP